MQEAPGITGGAPAYETLTDVYRGAEPRASLTAEFDGPPVKDQLPVTLRLDLIQVAAGEVFTARGMEGYYPTPAPMLLVRREGTASAVFVAVLQALEKGEAPAIRKVSLTPVRLAALDRPPEAPEALGVRLELPTHDYTVVSSAVDGPVHCGEFVSNNPATVWRTPDAAH